MPKRSTRRKLAVRKRPTSTKGILGDVPQRPKFTPACLADYEMLAKQSFSRPAWEYINSGSADEHTVRWNVEALARTRLKPNVMVDVTKIDTRIRLFGHDMPHPILIAPT
jgi:hypothetical protein